MPALDAMYGRGRMRGAVRDRIASFSMSTVLVPVRSGDLAVGQPTLEIDGAASVPLNLLDISVGGVSVSGPLLNLTQEMSGRLMFAIQVAGERRALDLQVAVRQMLPDSDPHLAWYGFECVGLDAPERLLRLASAHQVQGDAA